MAIQIKSTKHASPPRVLLHGNEKVGKSTFASQASGALFLPTEEGLKGIDANALTMDGKPRLETYDEFDQALSHAEQNTDQFETLVIDSADWLEALIHEKICTDDNVDSIELAAGGYGKGYTKATNLWRSLLGRLDNINHQGKAIILICHSKAVLFNDPLSEPYDKWQLKLHTSKSGNGSLEVLKEWADVIGFAEAEKFVRKTTSDDTKHRATVSGRRWLHLQETAGFIAGNRYNLPSKIDLSWNAFMNTFQESKPQQTTQTENQPVSEAA
jgi:hypothetical protein